MTLRGSTTLSRRSWSKPPTSRRRMWSLRGSGDGGGGLIARAVHASSASLQAELEGSRISAGSIPAEEGDELLQLPRPLRRAADKLGATAVLQLPIQAGGAVIGSLELMRRRGAFDERERALARTAAGQVALAHQAFGEGDGAHRSMADLLELAGDALAAGSEETRAADQLAALAGEIDRRDRVPPLALRARRARAGRALGPGCDGRPGCCARGRSARPRLDRPGVARAARGLSGRRRHPRHPATRAASARRTAARPRGGAGPTRCSHGSGPSPFAQPTRCGRATAGGRSRSSSSAPGRC